jgi:uncharacterized protein Yka (UPF0111/DUF47 family)
MTEKAHIIDALGERRLLLPTLLNQALAANDRSKYLFTLLQMALSHAERPDAPVSDLRTERQAAGVSDEGLDAVVASSSKVGTAKYRIPRVQGICAQLYEELERMLEPIRAAEVEEADSFSGRLKLLCAKPWCSADDLISSAQVDAMTSARRQGGDSLHLLVMDMHKVLNRLQAGIASEIIDGAHVYQVHPADRSLIAAFMRGVNASRPLKFEHPGLGTTVTRAGDQLVLQNDIGTTDAHVLVVHVEGVRVTLTYTDVHMQRLLFFQSLFDTWRVDWDDTRSRTDRSMEEGVYHLCVGTFNARDAQELERYLAFLGSRLVFLIDWNRARKRVRQLLPKKEALALLKWAADNDFGHMAFLRAGGEQVIYDALGFVAKAQISLGARLDEVLGREAAFEYMKFVVKSCTRGLLEGRSEGLIQDEIRAELVNYFHSAQQSLLDVAAEHAALSIEIAYGIRDGLLNAHSPDAAQLFARNAVRAKDWEHRADELVNHARGLVRRSERADFYRALIENADDVADELEEAAFHLTLMPHEDRSAALYQPLSSLAALVVEGAQEYLKALETARTLHRGGPREDMQDFLEAIHRIIGSERQGDTAQRIVKKTLMESAVDCRQLFMFSECARNLEAATDALMHTGLQLRDFVMSEVIAE